ncbi:MAG: tRNA (N(6)-L-threonylcarbamoyladenosine(37)-C(2))-methylthiotransferase MtaB [Desulfobacterales bacterium]|jgi:threonylcarbamoyladenosine tRNA methylthiotransferase MtaB|nr:tRNA (N(6)-L-threonylcarbamoyladenosine(37)-C(2))-methylthiotransferase MtaB [Desulfobacterales bacterium]
MPTFRIITLGCKVNQAESESIAGRLTGPDWQPAGPGEEADLCIVNTCAVTQKAAMQSRQAVRHAIHVNPRACVAATGCYAEIDPQALMGIRGLDGIVDQAGKARLPETIRRGGIAKNSRPALLSGGGETLRPPAVSSFAAPVGRTRPFLKVQDGCDAFCTYCIVPYARGRSRSSEPQAVVAGVERLAAQGFHEVVLTGIHIGLYGRDLNPRSSLLELLQRLQTLQTPVRVRLSSIEPLELSDEIISLAAGSDRFCRHFHIPLQSGDAEILKRMRRPYSPEAFGTLVRKVRLLLPDAAIGADVLVGFPGESETAFKNTCRLIEALPLTYLHVFPFSARPGTAAHGFAGKVPPERIKQRCGRLRQIGSRKRHGFHSSVVGRAVQVLTESRRDPKTGLLKGVSSNYLPVLFEGGDALMNRLVMVRITKADAVRLMGHLVETPE